MTNCGLISGKARNFSVIESVCYGSGVYPANYSVSAWRSYSGDKQEGYKADHSLPSNEEIKNEWRYISTPECEFLACIVFPFMLICKYSINIFVIFFLNIRLSHKTVNLNM
jgi:hypothetical protein